MMEKNKLYLIIAIVVIVGIVAIFSLTFLTAGDQNLTGAAAWVGGNSCNCKGDGDCTACCKDISCGSSAGCSTCGGTWGAKAA